MNKIQHLLTQKKWKAARSQILEELAFDSTSHWLWMHLSLTYYEQRQYAKAVECSRRAVELKPSCPLAIWHYAGSLEMAGKEQEALALWTMLLEIDMETIASGDCEEGMDWAMQLVNDVHFRMGQLYKAQGKTDLAEVSFKKYLHNRSHGVGSIYDAKIAKRFLAQQAKAAAAG